MSKPKIRWTIERVARLGFLIGQGFDATRVAEDPLIDTTANNVYRQALRFGLAFRELSPARVNLPPEAAFIYDLAAEKRGLTREALIRQLVLTAGRDPNLIRNILDDGA
ncbi:MAG: hypothetical protein ACLQIQ_08715 [Beijerinckiaceae bacterium]